MIKTYRQPQNAVLTSGRQIARAVIKDIIPPAPARLIELPRYRPVSSAFDDEGAIVVPTADTG
jgi:hypothetical protein